ncbi:MAG: NAD-dependent epimerase/dehydratase family protein [Anaerolineae bacterium]|jgi:UDP-glucose 4-epimerase|nr:NAD(P)-dependent oxidoreductase [Chloroflexota bacterium]
MRVLVTGAFGNLGQPVVEQLIRAGHRVRAFDLDSRPNRKAARRFGQDLEVVWGSLTSEEDIARAVEGQEAVIHLAFVLPYLSATGVSSETEPRWARDINVGGTRRLLNALRAMPQPARILFTSSLHVYGQTREQQPYRQVDDPVAPTDHYSHHKIICETLVKRSQLQWTIFRLGASLPARLILDKAMFEVPLDTRIEFVHASDVALAISNALDNDAVWGQIWNIGGGPECQLMQGDMVRSVLDCVGVGMLPESAFGHEPFPTDWLDTTESQRWLRFQYHTLKDYLDDVRAKLGPARGLLKVVSPLVRAYLLFVAANARLH